MMSALVYRRDRIDEAAATTTMAPVIGGFEVSLALLALAPLIGVFSAAQPSPASRWRYLG